MPHDQSENQKPQECDHREDITKNEAAILAFDPLLHLALEVLWRFRDAYPLFAPRIKFAVLDHRFSPNASFSMFLARFRRTATLFSVMPKTSAICACDKPSSMSTIICR